MKKRWVKVLCIIIITFSLLSAYLLIPWPTKSVGDKPDDAYRVVSYNLKYAEDWKEEFHGRKLAIVDQLGDYNADIIAVQEANYGWMNDYDGLPTLLDDYNYIGVGREDGEITGEYAAIFYKKDKFNVLESGTFWLSETPNDASIGWDASTYRICSYAVFKDKQSGEVFAHYNTHLDHESAAARVNSMMLIEEKLSEQQYPYILSGDFNFPESDPLYYLLAADIFSDSKTIAKDSMDYGTINYFLNFNFRHFIAIDYIFTKKDAFDVLQYRVDPSYRYDGRYISDHFPIIVDFKLL